MTHHEETIPARLPLLGADAIRGLGPVVNLIRLQIRAGRADEGRRRLCDTAEGRWAEAPVHIEVPQRHLEGL